MKLIKMFFLSVILLAAYLLNSCAIFSSKEQEKDVVLKILNPSFIQPSGLKLKLDETGQNITYTGLIELVKASTPILVYDKVELAISITALNYRDKNGNYHISRPVNFAGGVSQTFDFPIGVYVLPTLPLLIAQNTFVKTPNPQTGNFDRYKISFGIVARYKQGSDGTFVRSVPIQFNDLLFLNSGTPPPVGTYPPINDFSKQYVISHRTFYYQTDDPFDQFLQAYPDDVSRWP